MKPAKTVAILHQGGHEVVAASPQSGVNTITGEGLKEAMADAEVAIDLANSPHLKKAMLEFFAADDVAAIVADVAPTAPRNGTVEITDPERAPLSEIVDRYLKARLP